MQVEIRPLQIEDAKISYKWRNNSEVWKYTGSKPDRIITEEIETEWLRDVLNRNNEKRYAIIVDGTYIGNTQLLNITDADAEFHIFIGDTNYWGKGIGNRALQLVIEQAKLLNLKQIKLRVNKDNIPAYKIYKKNGFKVIKQSENIIEMELNLNAPISKTSETIVAVRERVISLSAQIYYKTNSVTYNELLKYLKLNDNDFIPNLSSRVSLCMYAKKIVKNAVIFEAWNNKKLIATVIAYINDIEKEVAYITLVHCKKEYRRQGIVENLLQMCYKKCMENDFKEILLDVSKDNFGALSLYKKNKFNIVKDTGNNRILMKKQLIENNI